MSLFRVWFVKHEMSASERDKWLKYRANPEQIPAPVIRYRKKRMVEDVEAESMEFAIASINSLPEKEGDPFNRVWGACPASQWVKSAYINELFHADDMDLFSESEMEACKK